MLILPVKRKWFDLIKSGDKDHEYRLINEYWTKRLVGKTYSKVVITLGYPRRCDTEKRIEFPYRGMTEVLITCEEFGEKPVWVYQIPLIKHRVGLRHSDILRELNECPGCIVESGFIEYVCCEEHWRLLE